MDARFKTTVADVMNEIRRQDVKFGKDRSCHPLEWMSILQEEVGEAAREINDSDFIAYKLKENYRQELVQIVAVAMQAILNYDRLTVMSSCIGCDGKFYDEDLVQDDASENYCPGCAAVLFPVMKAEYEEMKRNGEIDEDE